MSVAVSVLLDVVVRCSSCRAWRRQRTDTALRACVCVRVCLYVCVLHQCPEFVWYCQCCQCHFGEHSMIPHLRASPSSTFTLLSIRFRSFLSVFGFVMPRFPFVFYFFRLDLDSFVSIASALHECSHGVHRLYFCQYH